MNIFTSIVLGIVQGLTEFLPISSSGHLLILQNIFGWHTSNDLAYDVFLHWGTLLALLIYFYKDIIRYLAAFLKSLQKRELKTNLDQKIAWLILWSMIPAVLVGLFLNDIIDLVFANLFSIACFLIVIGLVFVLVEKYGSKAKDLNSLNWSKTLFLGISQALALIPGVSRSGATISTGLALNLNRESAARFSFLMSIPIVFAAGCKEIWDLRHAVLSGNEIMIFMVGFAIAALIGFWSIRFLLNYLKGHSLKAFAYYRIILGILVLLYIMLK